MPLSRLDVALTLAAKGFKLFPLAPYDDAGQTKWRPALKRFADKATSDTAQLRNWFDGTDKAIALLAGEGLLIVDLDNKNGKHGSAAWAELDLVEGCPDTMRLKTAHGEHWFYNVTDAYGPGVNKIAKGIDHRGDGSYVRIHDTLFDPTALDTPIAAAPEWLTQRLSKPKERSPDADIIPEGVDLDSEYNVARAVEFIEAAGPALEGERNMRCFQIASDVRALGISRTTCRGLLLDHWDCSLPVESPDEFERTVNSAYDNAKRPIASNDPDAQFEAAPPKETDPSLGPFTASEIMEREFERARYAWDFGFIVIGHPNIFTGDGGVGKTTADIQLGAAIAAGVPFLGYDTVQMPVLLVLCEDDYGETKHRLQASCAELGVDIDTLPLTVWCRVNQENTIASVDDKGAWRKGEFYAALRERLLKIGPCLCFLDPAGDLFELDETKRPSVNTVAKRVLGGLTAETGATFVLNHHPSKKSMEDGSHFSGTTAWRTAFRSMMVMKAPDKAGPLRELSTTKSQYRKLSEMQIWANDGYFSSIDSKDANEARERQIEAVFSTIQSLRDQGIAVVKTHGNGHRTKDIAAAVLETHGLKIDAATTLAHMSALERAGRIRWAANPGGKNRRPSTYEVCEIDPQFGDEDD